MGAVDTTKTVAKHPWTGVVVALIGLATGWIDLARQKNDLALKQKVVAEDSIGNAQQLAREQEKLRSALLDSVRAQEDLIDNMNDAERRLGALERTCTRGERAALDAPAPKGTGGSDADNDAAAIPDTASAAAPAAAPAPAPERAAPNTAALETRNKHAREIKWQRAMLSAPSALKLQSRF